MSRLSQTLSKEECRFIHKAKMAGKKADRERRFQAERQKIDRLGDIFTSDGTELMEDWLLTHPLHANEHTQNISNNVGEIVRRQSTEGKTDE
jgi:hypothetical protein